MSLCQSEGRLRRAVQTEDDEPANVTSMSFPLHHLECFASLANTLSFTQTARELRLSQPSVSRHIRQLEELVGAPLFIRDRQRVHLSETGRELKTQLLPLYEEMQRVLESTRGKARRIEGRIRIGSLYEFGQNTLVHHLLAFRAAHPGVEIQLELLKEIEIISRLHDGTLDFGIVTSADQEHLTAFALALEPAVLVTRAENRRPFDPGKRPPVIAYRRDDPLLDRFLRTHFKRWSRRNLEFAVVVNSHKAMLVALLATDAYAAMPIHSVQALLDAGRLRLACDRELKNKLYLVFAASNQVEERHRVFRKFLLDTVRAQ